MKFSSALALGAASLLLSALSAGCGAAQRAAAKDPIKCERDPDCVGKQGRSRDCSTACSDNIDCMERCQQIQRGVNP